MKICHFTSTHKEKDQRADYVNNCHERYEFFRDGGDTLQTAYNNKRCENQKRNTRYVCRNIECRLHIAGDRVDLAHVADTKGRQHAEDGEQYGKHRAHLLKSFVRAKPVL